MTDKQIIEHKLLYEGLDWSVGVDGMFINPKQIPYTNCLYELALACDSKSKQLKRKEQECETLASQLDFEVQKKECLEQECEELKDKLNCCFCNPYVELNDIEKQRKCVEVTECFRRQLDQLKAENEELKEYIKHLHNLCGNETDKQYKYKQTLTEIKEVLQFYNNTTIGVYKGNGIFEFEVSNDNVGKLIYCYDTNPAKRALQKISECEVVDET